MSVGRGPLRPVTCRLAVRGAVCQQKRCLLFAATCTSTRHSFTALDATTLYFAPFLKALTEHSRAACSARRAAGGRAVAGRLHAVGRHRRRAAAAACQQPRGMPQHLSPANPCHCTKQCLVLLAGGGVSQEMAERMPTEEAIAAATSIEI